MQTPNQIPCAAVPQALTSQAQVWDQWEALKKAGHAPPTHQADEEANAIAARLMAADVVLTTYQVD